MSLSKEERKRFSRHISLTEVGVEGQQKLKDASVLIVGTGGLGSPIALYLAASGVGRLGLIDFDVVDESNLQRQIIHGTSDIGVSKLKSAAKRIKEVNPFVKLDLYEQRLTADNAINIINQYDVVTDGTDNFQTRYLVNDTCVLTGKPNVFGSIRQFEGQVSVYWAEQGPCYRCLFPDPPAPGSVPSCAEAGVLGVLPGVIGTLQATEVIKLILNIGEPLIGRLINYNALKMSFNQVKFMKDPDCPVCGQQPKIKKPIDYDAFCGLEKDNHTETKVEITAKELYDLLKSQQDIVIIDVRESEELASGIIPNATHIPMDQILENINQIPKDMKVIVYCHLGIRSYNVQQLLKQQGYNNVINLTGGIEAWDNLNN